MDGIETLKQWVMDSDNIDSLEVQVYLRRAAFRISGVWTDFITRNTIIRRKPS